MNAVEREIADLINRYIEDEETAEDIACDIMKVIRSKNVSEIIE